MSRDMKPRRSQPSKKKAAGGTLVGMFIGLVIGIALAAGVVWYLNKSPLPFVDRAQPPARGDGANGKNGQPTQPLALPGKPGDPIPEKRFQFYDILPGKADAVPDKAPKADAKKEEPKKDEAKKEDKKEEPKESKTPLFLQDADNQKAKLAFMGIEAVVQQVMIQDKTFYRVRVGPYTKIDELNKVRAELAKSGIEAQLAK